MSKLLMCIHIKVLALIKVIFHFCGSHTEGTGKSSSMLSKIGAMDIVLLLSKRGDSVIF